MDKPENYDEVQAKGEFEPLELGGHICKILDAVCKETKTGKEAIYLYLDIAEGRQRDYYKKLYDEDKREDKKWGCIYIQLTQGESTAFFKGLITSIEKSNEGYIFKFDEKTLKNKIIGGVFGREQYIDKEGKYRFIIRCVQIRSVDAIRNGVAIPPDKMKKADDIDEAFISVDDELPFPE